MLLKPVPGQGCSCYPDRCCAHSPLWRRGTFCRPSSWFRVQGIGSLRPAASGQAPLSIGRYCRHHECNLIKRIIVFCSKLLSNSAKTVTFHLTPCQQACTQHAAGQQQHPGREGRTRNGYRPLCQGCSSHRPAVMLGAGLDTCSWLVKSRVSCNLVWLPGRFSLLAHPDARPSQPWMMMMMMI